MIGRWSEPPVKKEEPKPLGFDDFELRIGDVMRGERATMGKSLLDVQRELRIKAAYIAAIENADPSVFETPGFIAGFVRSYARYLNLDPEWAFGRFCQESGFETSHGLSAAASGVRTGGHAEAPAAKGRGRAPKTRDPLADPNASFVPSAEAAWSRIEPGAIGSSLVLVALIAALGYGGWSVLQEIQRVRFAPVEQAPGVASDLSGLAPEAVERATALETADSGVTVASSPDALNRLYRPQALDVPVLTARDGPIAALDPSRNGALAGATTTPPRPSVVADATADRDTAVELAIAEAVASLGGTIDDDAVQVVAEAAPGVVMFAVRPSWVRVRAADGTVIFEKILDAGERYELPATEEAPLLRAGNAGSVYFTIGGETYGPAGSGPSVVKNVALGVDELKTSYPVADLSRDSDLARFVAIAEVEPTSGN